MERGRNPDLRKGKSVGFREEKKELVGTFLMDVQEAGDIKEV